MTVIFDAHVQQRTWRGYDDPGLPVGMYITQGSVLGDVSGGNQLVIHAFKGEAEPASGRFFNIEQIDVHFTSAVPTIIFLRAANWEISGPTGLINREWRALLQPNDNDVAAMMNDGAFPLPLFLGIVAPVSDLAVQLELGTDNADGITLFSTIQGYIWEARSVLSEGGLRRPIDSLYGR